MTKTTTLITILVFCDHFSSLHGLGGFPPQFLPAVCLCHACTQRQVFSHLFHSNLSSHTPESPPFVIHHSEFLVQPRHVLFLFFVFIVKKKSSALGSNKLKSVTLYFTHSNNLCLSVNHHLLPPLLFHSFSHYHPFIQFHSTYSTDHSYLYLFSMHSCLLVASYFH